RKNGEKEVLVILNLSKEAVNFSIDDSLLSGELKNVFDKSKRDFTKDKNFSFKVSDFAVFEK
ncbi:MAG: 1,4-alpha-glucan branching protein, partial [Chryseobacterium sp.]